MDFEAPRVAEWTGEIPPGSCWDQEGQFSTDGPMSMGFNIIPPNTPLPVVVNHLKASGGLKAYASCTANRVGTVDTNVCRLVSVYLSDQDMVRLVESLKSQPEGYVIYDLKKTELFSDRTMWDAVTENAPGQNWKYLYLALCYNYSHVCSILDDYVTTNHDRRMKLGILTNVCVLCTVGLSYFICDSMKKKYKLPGQRPMPGDIRAMRFNGLVTY